MLTALKQGIERYKYKLFYIDFATMNTLEVHFEFLRLFDIYDEVSDTIVKYESDIKSMEDEVTEKTEKIKEYLQILKDGTEVGITRDPAHIILEPGAVILDPLSYYRNKIQELNVELINIDNEIKSKNANLQDYYKELEEITELISETGMVKINYFGPLISLCERIKWITFEEWDEKYKKAVWTERLV